MIEKNIKKINISKRLLLILMSVLLVLSIFIHITDVFAATALPVQISASPTGSIVSDSSLVPGVNPSGSPSPSSSPTATKEPEFLQDFTIPPLQSTENPNASSQPNKTVKPDSSVATIGIVEVDNIETKRPFMWSDLIKYLAYAFFGLAIVAVIYGLISMAVLIFFKKDITLAGLRKRKNEKKKKNKK